MGCFWNSEKRESFKINMILKWFFPNYWFFSYNLGIKPTTCKNFEVKVRKKIYKRKLYNINTQSLYFIHRISSIMYTRRTRAPSLPSSEGAAACGSPCMGRTKEEARGSYGLSRGLCLEWLRKTPVGGADYHWDVGPAMGHPGVWRTRPSSFPDRCHGGTSRW